MQVDQTSGTRGRPDVLLALAQYRRHNGRMHFGILLSAASLQTKGGPAMKLAVGQPVVGHKAAPALHE